MSTFRKLGTLDQIMARALGLSIAATVAWIPGHPTSGLEPDKAVTQYALDSWQIEDGLPLNSIRGVTQGPEGFLWLATFEGLTRFDGHRFEIIDSSQAPELRVFVTAVLTTRQGQLWVGAQGGLGRLTDGRLESFTAEDGLVHDGVQTLYEDRAEDLWIGTQSGLARWRDGRFTSFTTDDGLVHENVQDILEDRAGNLWVATAGGLARYRDGEWSQVTSGGLETANVTALAENESGALWVGTAGRGLVKLVAGEDRATRLTTADGLLSNAIKTLYRDRWGSLWIGTENHGLSRWSDGKWSHLTTADGLSDDSIRELYEDREGSLWIATWGGGLARLKESRITPYGPPEGLPDELVSAILEDRDGDLWIGTRAGLSRWRAGRFQTWTTADGLAYDSVVSLEEDRDGSLWIGTRGGGLSRWRNGRFQTWTTADGLSHDDVRAILERKRGGLWLATWGGGLNLLHDGRFTSYRAADGLAHDFTMALHEDRLGHLWIGTSAGLSRLQQGDSRDGDPKAGPFETFTTADGLGSDVVVTFHEEEDGTLWIGTIGGLTRYRDGEFLNFTTADGLFDDRVFRILESPDGHFWMSCNRGIFRVAKAELEDLAEGRRETVSSHVYSTPDGMRSPECNGGFHPAGWQDRQGHLWFPTIRGLAQIHPERQILNPLPPPVVIDRLAAGNETLRPPNGDVLELDVRDFEIRYAGLSLRDPDRVRFRYRLEDYDETWVDAGSRRQAFYTNIPPGSYRFRVVASNDDGVWNETGDELRLYLRPRFYETWTFLGICAVALALIGRGVYRLRVRHFHRRYDELYQLKQKLEQKNAEIEATQAEIERKNLELKDQNEEIERFAYTVSHDLKSPLITIEGFLGLVEKDARAGDPQRLSSDMARIRGAVGKMQELLDDLLELSRIGRLANPPQDVGVATLVAEARELVSGRLDRGRVHLVVADDLPTIHGDRARLREVFQNLIDNAAKYMGEQKNPEVEIGARAESGEVLCWVRDNGIGIDPDYRSQVFGLFKQLDPESEGTGIGLTQVERIVRFHGGRIWIESEGRGRGSVFFFTLPKAQGP